MKKEDFTKKITLSEVLLTQPCSYGFNHVAKIFKLPYHDDVYYNPDTEGKKTFTLLELIAYVDTLPIIKTIGDWNTSEFSPFENDDRYQWSSVCHIGWILRQILAREGHIPYQSHMIDEGDAEILNTVIVYQVYTFVQTIPSLMKKVRTLQKTKFTL